MCKRIVNILCLTLDKQCDKTQFWSFKTAEINKNLAYLIALAMFGLVATTCLCLSGLYEAQMTKRLIGIAIFVLQLILVWLASKRW